TVQRNNPESSPLHWIAGQRALRADGSQGLLASQSAQAPPKLLAAITAEAAMLDREETTVLAVEFAEAENQALERAERMR
ncbi:MAG: hypothetical protein KDJ54_14420, partial [Candidatus Competibacteraceae bacterium]|nr:hypothetical protein [Candidatus Competibacteraceae bacterium]